MGDDRPQRIAGALDTLVKTLLPPLGEEDVASLDERRDDALALANDMLDTCVSVPSLFLTYSSADMRQAIRDRPSFLMSTILRS